MCELTNLIKSMVDEKDPSYKTQKLISLLAQATDSKFRHLEKNIISGLTEHSLLLKDIQDSNIKLYQALEERVGKNDLYFRDKIEEHNANCPHKIPEKLEKINLLFMFIQYPKVFWLSVVGILAFMGLGIDKLIELLSMVI